MQVIVTRPAAQAREWVDALRLHGIDAQALPLIGIAPAADAAPLEAAWQSLHTRRLVVFVSPNAAEQFFACRPEPNEPAVAVAPRPNGNQRAADPPERSDRRPAAPLNSAGPWIDGAATAAPAAPGAAMFPATSSAIPPARLHLIWPAAVFAGSPGPGTSQVLRRLGVPAAAILEPAADAPQFDSESLWATLRQHDWQGASALIVRGDGGREWLADTLTQAGAQVDRLAAYRRTPPVLGPEAWTLFAAAAERPQARLWLFSSSEAIDHLADLFHSVTPVCAPAHLPRSTSATASGAEPPGVLRVPAAAGRAASDISPPVTRAIAPQAASVPAFGPVGRVAPNWPAASAIATHPRIAERARRIGFGTVVLARPALAAVVACIQSWRL